MKTSSSTTSPPDSSTGGHTIFHIHIHSAGKHAAFTSWSARSPPSAYTSHFMVGTNATIHTRLHITAGTHAAFTLIAWSARTPPSTSTSTTSIYRLARTPPSLLRDTNATFRFQIQKSIATNTIFHIHVQLSVGTIATFHIHISAATHTTSTFTSRSAQTPPSTTTSQSDIKFECLSLGRHERCFPHSRTPPPHLLLGQRKRHLPQSRLNRILNVHFLTGTNAAFHIHIAAGTNAIYIHSMTGTNAAFFFSTGTNAAHVHEHSHTQSDRHERRHLLLGRHRHHLQSFAHTCTCLLYTSPSPRD